MKARVFSQRIWRHIFFSFLFCGFIFTSAVFAADATGQDLADSYSSQELTQMLAPIALYPDALLSQILMASTYPIEVIEADRWVKKNPHLDGNALDEALYEKNWDPSVQALCHFPSTLAQMSEQITETTALGNAFLAQEGDVMETVQHLREKAHAEGHLYSNKQQTVIVETDTIVIEPVYPHLIYVPYYDPYYVYGSWWYPGYLPHYWGPSSVHLGFGISFSPGVRLNFAFGSWSYFDWPRHRIYINTRKKPGFVHKNRVISTHIWRHVPTHRRGVVYRDKRTAQRYGLSPQRSKESRRENHIFSNERGKVIRSKRYESRTPTIWKQPQRQAPAVRVIKSQQQHRKTSSEQNVRKMPQSKRPISDQKQQFKKREMRKSPQTQTSQREHEKVSNRIINGDEERRSESGKHGSKGRGEGPRK